MSHKLNRFSRDVLEKPQLLTMERFKEIDAYLSDRNSGIYQAALDATKEKVKEEFLKIEDGVAMIEVSGALTYKSTFWQALCGGISYQQLLREVNTVSARDDVNTIVLMVDSGGGHAFNCFSTARQMREIADNSGKKLIAYVDGLAASAAYALTCVCHEVIIPQDGEAGSIGVVVKLQDRSEKDKKDGVKNIFITGGKDKVPFDEDGAFKESYLADIQKRVDSLYNNFVSHVAAYRSLSEDVVRATEAKVFSAEEALEIGLVDKIMETDQFFSYLSTEVTSSAGISQPIGVNMSLENETPAELTADAPVVEELLNENDTQTTVEANEDVVATPDMSAEMAALQQQIADMQATLAAQTEAATLAQQEAAAAKAALDATKMAEFENTASAWAFAGVDAKAFAESAMTGSIPVDMFEAAMNKVQETMETMDGMKELGAAVEETPVAEAPKDGVEAALAAQKKIK